MMGGMEAQTQTDNLDSTEKIAKSIAVDAGYAHLWREYHPIVKATIEWLHEHNYLIIVDPWKDNDD